MNMQCEWIMHAKGLEQCLAQIEYLMMASLLSSPPDLTLGRICQFNPRKVLLRFRKKKR